MLVAFCWRVRVIFSVSSEALDKVGTAVCLNDTTDLTYLESASCVFKGLHHLSGAEFAKVTTLAVRAAVAALQGSLFERDLTGGDLLMPHKELLDGLVARDVGSGLVGAAGYRIAATLVLDQQVRSTNFAAHLELVYVT